MSHPAEPPKKIRRTKKREIRSRMGNFLMFLPNMVRLLGRLLSDARVPAAEKALFAGALIYFFIPLDLIPDMVPFIGQVDDIYLIALALLRLIYRTDASVVRRHWKGGGDIAALAQSIAGIAPALLPKRVSRVISSRIELAPAASKALEGITRRGEPLIREISEPEKKILVDSGERASN